MIHTAQFYKILNKSEIEYLIKKFKDDINLISLKINEIYLDKGIVITFYKRFGVYYMFLDIDFIKLISKSVITEKDYFNIQSCINIFLENVFGYSFDMILIRLDYRLDLKILNKNDKYFLLNALNKSINKYGFKKKYNKYKTCKYFNSKSVQFKIYDKEKERKDKGAKIEEYERNVLRLEIALRNKHLNYKKRNGYKKQLKTYLNNELYKNYFNDIFDGIIYRGDFLKIYMADKIINKSELDLKNKKKVREFLIDISKHREINLLFNILDSDGKQKYTKYKYKKYISILNDLNINPILIPKNLKGTSKRIKNPLKYLNDKLDNCQ
ncbi:hypothetical protein LTY04_001642 [Clostridium perfringens]